MKPCTFFVAYNYRGKFLLFSIKLLVSSVSYMTYNYNYYKWNQVHGGVHTDILNS